MKALLLIAALLAGNALAEDASTVGQVASAGAGGAA
jgi:hypothetical protein